MNELTEIDILRLQTQALEDLAQARTIIGDAKHYPPNIDLNQALYLMLRASKQMGVVHAWLNEEDPDDRFASYMDWRFGHEWHTSAVQEANADYISEEAWHLQRQLQQIMD